MAHHHQTGPSCFYAQYFQLLKIKNYLKYTNIQNLFNINLIYIKINKLSAGITMCCRNINKY